MCIRDSFQNGFDDNKALIYKGRSSSLLGIELLLEKFLKIGAVIFSKSKRQAQNPQAVNHSFADFRGYEPY